MADDHTVKVRIGPPSVLFFIFLALKLCKVISWSWWWVFSPFWILLALAGVILVGAAVWSIFKR